MTVHQIFFERLGQFILFAKAYEKVDDNSNLKSSNLNF